eukprot:228450-Chlamydomonas_euryale.AAC.6
MPAASAVGNTSVPVCIPLHHRPCTRHQAALHHAPCTPHRTCSTLHHTSSAPHPAPSTSEPCTLHPAPLHPNLRFEAFSVPRRAGMHRDSAATPHAPPTCSMRNSWLYLARRSERHGAPVLI